MARPRFTTRFTLRIAPGLREDLQYEADIVGNNFADHVREILIRHVDRSDGRLTTDRRKAAAR
jgi:hypothetical protein